MTVIVWAVMSVTAFAALLWLCDHGKWLFDLDTIGSPQKGTVMLQLPLLGQNGFLGGVVTPSIITGSSTAYSTASTRTGPEYSSGAALKG